MQTNPHSKPGPKPNPARRYVRRLISLPPDTDAELARLMRLHKLQRSPMLAHLITLGIIELETAIKQSAGH
jgi:hypothetical protein